VLCTDTNVQGSRAQEGRTTNGRPTSCDSVNPVTEDAAIRFALRLSTSRTGHSLAFERAVSSWDVVDRVPDSPPPGSENPDHRTPPGEPAKLVRRRVRSGGFAVSLWGGPSDGALEAMISPTLWSTLRSHPRSRSCLTRIRRGGGTWSNADKIRVVEESYRGHRQVSATARWHGSTGPGPRRLRCLPGEVRGLPGRRRDGILRRHRAVGFIPGSIDRA
jgi:hypothetical protein